jgi:hypothetical protein
VNQGGMALVNNSDTVTASVCIVGTEGSIVILKCMLDPRGIEDVNKVVKTYPKHLC